MNMLANDIGRCSHLEVVQLIIIRHEVGVPEFYRLSAVSPEEKRLGRSFFVEGRLNVLPQREETLLRIVPAQFVQDDVFLNRCGLVLTQVSSSVPVVVHAGVSVRCTVSRRQSVEDEITGTPVRLDGFVRARRVSLHRGSFDRGTIFRKKISHERAIHGVIGRLIQVVVIFVANKILCEIPSRVEFPDGLTTKHLMPGQAAIQINFLVIFQHGHTRLVFFPSHRQRWMRGPVPRYTGNEKWVAGILNYWHPVDVLVQYELSVITLLLDWLSILVSHNL